METEQSYDDLRQQRIDEMTEKFGVLPNGRDFEIVQNEYRDSYDEFVRRICSIMAWSPREATVWMTTNNPLLGGTSPVSMMARDRLVRLDAFIIDAEREAADHG
jgi:hypothetical protein